MGTLPKIIFVNRVYWPAAAATAQLLTDLAELLAARGWPVEVVAAGSGEESRNGVSIVRCGGKDAPKAGLATRAGSYLRFLAGARGRLKRTLQQGEIVILMTDPPMLAPVLAGLVRKRRARLVNWIQDIYPEIAAVHAGPVLGSLVSCLRGPRDSAWQQAHCNITLGRDMAAFVASRGVPEDRCRVLPNWAPAELQAIPSRAQAAAIRMRWGAEGKLVVAYSGNLGRVHEFETFLDAATRLRAQPDIVFIFVASGPRLREVKHLAAERGLPNVQFLPPVPRDELRTSLAAADVHLVSVRPGFESLVFPSKIAGILAASRPLLFVGPRNYEVSSLVRSLDCGFCFENRDSGELARTVLRLQSNRDLARRLGENSRRAFERHYSLPSQGDYWERCLTSVAQC